MKNSSNIRKNNAKTLGLLLAALVPAGAALADGGRYHRHDRHVEVGGTVTVTKEIPGGVITVGATIGRPQPTVVHEKVVVVKERAPEKVVIIEKEPVREKVIIVKERPVEKKVIIVEKHGRHGKRVKKVIVHEGRGHRGHGRDWDRDDRWEDRHDRDWDRGHGHARQVSYQQQDGRGNTHYYRDENQVSESYSGPEGSYHYYEDRNQVSIQDNRYGQNKHVYVKK